MKTDTVCSDNFKVTFTRVFQFSNKGGNMKTKLLVSSLLIMFVAITFAGCAVMPTKTTPDLSCAKGRISEMLSSGIYQKKVDNFIIIQDATQSMSEKVDKTSSYGKLALSKGLINCMNNALVEELELQAGMRVFGAMPSENGLVYGMTNYTKAGLNEAVDGLQKTDKLSNLSDAIFDAANDLKQVSGYSAVIIFTDAEKQENVDPVAAAAEMKKMYGDKVCIYPVLMGDDPDGMMLAQDIAAQGGCGFAISADELYLKPLAECDTVSTGKGMGDFVARVFLDGDDDRDGVVNSRDQCPNTPLGVIVNSVGCPIDSDKDSVPDGLDKCPDTPTGVKVDEFGCPLPDLDSDGDGVPDSRDKCPDTPKGVKVDENGCPIAMQEKVSVALYVQFDFDKASVKPEYYADIEKTANFLKAYPDTKVELEGHTDSIGTDEYNMDLGRRRAASVKKYLVDKFGIDAARITTTSYGKSNPVDTNDPPDGGKNNRRVVATIEAMVK